jgi:DNA-binding NtrC family response regulator
MVSKQLEGAAAESPEDQGPNIEVPAHLTFPLDVKNLDFQQQKEEFEKQFIISALKVFNGKINQTAIHANIPKKTLLRKLEKYGLFAKDYQDVD